MSIITGKEEKKVEYVELIYDLIFVYMVGRDNALLENMRNGFVAPQAFLTYILCTLSITQIWSFSTFYINMFGRNSIRDHVFLLTNMYLMYFLGEATRMDAASYIAQYHIAWGLILANTGLQYVIELRNHELDVWNRGIIRRMAATLFSEAVLAFSASFTHGYIAFFLSFAAIFTGIALTAFGKKVSIGGQVDFTHLTERAMLYVVFTFGEMVIAIASYFTGGGSFRPSVIYFSAMSFLIAIGLFLSYETIYNHLVDREGDYKGTLYMLLHIFLIFSLSNITVSFEFMREEQVRVLPKVLFMALSLVMYFLFLLSLNGHFKLHCRLKRSFVLRILLVSALFLAAMMLLRNNMALNILLSAAYTFFMVLTLYRMKQVQEKIRLQQKVL